MSRPLRMEFADAFYPVTSRGHQRGSIFLTDHDRGCGKPVPEFCLFGDDERRNYICNKQISKTPAPNPAR